MTALRIALMVVVLALTTLVLLPFQLVALAFDWPMRRRLPRFWHRIACYMLGIRVAVHGLPESGRPLMLAANHASWKDILVLGSIADVVFVARSDVRQWPVFGMLARLQKTIFVEREQKRRTGEQVDEIAARMAAGEVVVLFPEGTTSDGNRLLEIKSSLFGAVSGVAVQADGNPVYVQPVAIAYTGIQGVAMGRYHRSIAGWPGDVQLLPHLIGIMKAGAIEVDVSFGETESFRKGDNRKVLAANVAASIRRMLLESLRGRWRG